MPALLLAGRVASSPLRLSPACTWTVSRPAKNSPRSALGSFFGAPNTLSAREQVVDDNVRDLCPPRCPASCDVAPSNERRLQETIVRRDGSILRLRAEGRA